MFREIFQKYNKNIFLPKKEKKYTKLQNIDPTGSYNIIYVCIFKVKSFEQGIYTCTT